MDSTEKECFAHIHRFLLLSLNQKPKRSIAHGNILSPLLLLIAGVGSVCTGSVKFIKHGVGERRVEVMAEDKTVKATAYIPEINCILCGYRLLAREKNARTEGNGYYYQHTDNVPFCPNAGKKFKVAAVELEEI